MVQVEHFPFRLGGYGAIVCDPPWWFEDQSGRMKCDYLPMADEAILALPIDALAADRGHLYLWTVDTHLELALLCVRRWGFVYKRTIAWVKTLDDQRELEERINLAAREHNNKLVERLTARIGGVRIGGGHYVRSAHELCLFATRNLTGLVRDVPSVILAPHPRDTLTGKIIHSAKPSELQAIAERLSPEPRIELFARRARAGWRSWGNQAPDNGVVEWTAWK